MRAAEFQKLLSELSKPVPVLAPGTGKTKTGRLWIYLRDELHMQASWPLLPTRPALS